MFKIKKTSGETKYNQPQKVVKSVLSLQNANAAVERSLSDNKNTLTKERIGLLPETLIGLRRTKEYARDKGGSHCIVFTQNMLEAMKEAERKNDERILEEHKAEEEVRQKLKEDADKKKEQDALLKNAAKSKKNLEENEMFEQEERKLDEELNLAQRMLDQATTSLTEAIGKGDMVEVRVASELVNSSRKKVDEAVLMRKQHVKNRNKLGKKRINTIENMFSTMKKSKR